MATWVTLKQNFFEDHVLNAKNNNQLLQKILLALFTVSLFACAAKPKPAPEIYADEPATNYTYHAPPSMEASATESSGIAAPVEEATFTEPPVEEMNNVMPPMESMAAEEMPVESASSGMVMHDTNPTDISTVPASHFTVQIVASSNMKNLNAFATENGLSNELTAKVTVNDKTWNVLLLGTYPTLAAAKEALAGIKDKVSTSPWIRSVGSLQ